MELFQKIEALTGQTMEQYPAPEQDVMLLLERVNEAGRIALMQVRHSLPGLPMLTLALRCGQSSMQSAGRGLG